MNESNEQIDEQTDEQVEDETSDHSFTGWWAVAAIIIVVGGFLGWSELRIRSVRLELETLSSQMSALGNQNQSLQYQYDSARLRLETIRTASRTFKLTPPDETASGSATVYLDGANRNAVVVFEALLPNDRGTERYHLWLSGSGSEEQALASVFDVGESGRAELMMQHLPIETTITGMSVTLEPSDDINTPTGPVVLSGTP